MKERLGINAHLPSGPSLNLVPAAGIGSVRIDFNWYDLQPERHRWDWTVADQVVTDARARNLEIYATLSYTPAWANGGQGRNVPPDEISDWQTFVRACAERYRHNVWNWSLWNEPNIHGFWAGSLDQYLTLIVQPAAEILHGIGTENRVGAPDLSTEGDWPSWFQPCLEQACTWLDIIAVHSYQDTGREVWRALGQAKKWYEFWKKPSVRQVMQWAGCGGKPLWLTECGWKSNEIGELAQADNYDQLLEGLASNSWLERAFGYQLLDESGPDQPEADKWGIYRQDSTPKPAVEVFRRYGELPSV
jgi:polysaccharide biosynthesis protein PslG